MLCRLFDLKSHNVLLTRDGTGKIADVGLGQGLDAGGQHVLFCCKQASSMSNTCTQQVTGLLPPQLFLAEHIVCIM